MSGLLLPEIAKRPKPETTDTLDLYGLLISHPETAVPRHKSVYDDHADWYAGIVQRRSLIHLQIIPQIMAFIGDISGQQVVDVACGEGVFTRELASKGALVTGVDLSLRLLAIAETTHHDSQPTYIHDDARVLKKLPDASFDGATCIMAMMDIDDIDALLASVHRVTRPGAWLVVLITHPCFESPRARTERIDGAWARITTQYLTEGAWHGSEDGVRSRCGAQHRTISTYLNTAIGAGWNLERMIEPRLANVQSEVDHPGLFIMRFHRQL